MATTHVNSGIRLTVQQSTRLRKLSVELGMSRNAIIGALIENAELSLQLETTLPEGTFSYQDTREYTVAEGIDLLNNVLMLKGVTLVRNEQQLMVVDLEQIPEQLIPNVTSDRLGDRGRYEIVNCTFNLEFARADDLEPEIRDLVDDNYGRVIAIRLANQLVIRETVGNLRSIKALVDDAELRAKSQKRPVQSITLRVGSGDKPVRTPSLQTPPFGIGVVTAALIRASASIDSGQQGSSKKYRSY